MRTRIALTAATAAVILAFVSLLSTIASPTRTHSSPLDQATTYGFDSSHIATHLGIRPNGLVVYRTPVHLGTKTSLNSTRHVKTRTSSTLATNQGNVPVYVTEWMRPMPPEVKLVPVALQSPPTPIVLNDSNSTNTADWQCIRVHESGNRYNDPSAPSGAYGIELSTWRAYGFNGWPYQAAPALQDALALRLYNEYGWAPWSSRYACGL